MGWAKLDTPCNFAYHAREIESQWLQNLNPRLKKMFWLVRFLFPAAAL
jgi:hypothetical protein